MQDHSSTNASKSMRTFGITLGAFIGAFLVVFTLLVFKYNHSYQFAYKNSRFGGYLANHNYELIIIGSSRMRDNYDARTLETLSGKSCYVISYNRLTPLLMEPMLRYMITHGNHKQKYIIDAFTYGMVREFRLQDSRLFNDVPPSLKDEYLRKMRTYFQDFSLVEQYQLLAVEGNQDILFHWLTGEMIDRLSYHGSLTHNNTPGMTADEYQKLLTMESPIKEYNGTFQKEQENSLIAICNLLHRYNVEAIFVESPIMGYQKKDVRIVHAKAHLKTLIENQGYRYVDASSFFPINDYTLFLDDNHLSGKGRAEYSKRLVLHLQQCGFLNH